MYYNKKFVLTLRPKSHCKSASGGLGTELIMGIATEL